MTLPKTLQEKVAFELRKLSDDKTRNDTLDSIYSSGFCNGAEALFKILLEGMPDIEHALFNYLNAMVSTLERERESLKVRCDTLEVEVLRMHEQQGATKEVAKPSEQRHD